MESAFRTQPEIDPSIMNIPVEQIVHAAGYMLMPTMAEEGARDMRSNFETVEKGREMLRLGISFGTKGVKLSDDELTRFIEGDSILTILTNRLLTSGNVKHPFVIAEQEAELDEILGLDTPEGRRK